MTSKFITLIFCALSYSSKAQDSSANSKIVSKADSIPVFRKDIPTYAGGEVDLFYTLKKQKEKQLKLDSLESGFDSLQIRIWYDYALFINRELLVIKRANGQWTAEHHEMTIDWDVTNVMETIKADKVRSVTPVSGWDKFIAELLLFKIMILPNMNDIPDLVDNWTDGVTYNVEIATKKQYRFYGYHLPDKFADKYWQAKNMTTIISLLSKELMQ